MTLIDEHDRQRLRLGANLLWNLSHNPDAEYSDSDRDAAGEASLTLDLLLRRTRDTNPEAEE